MPLQFKVHVPYGDGTIEVTADTFAEIHEAAARLYELERDAKYLLSRGAKRIAPDYHLDGEKNAYYGWREHATGRSVTFGQNKEKGLSVPFFPKGEAGYWELDNAPEAPAERPANGRSGTLTPMQAKAADTMRSAGVTGAAAVELLGRHGAERISELSDSDAALVVADILAEA